MYQGGAPRLNPHATQCHSGAENELKWEQRLKGLVYMGKNIKQEKVGTVTHLLIFQGALLINTCVGVAPNPGSFPHAYGGSLVTINLSKVYFPQMSFKFVG